MFFFESFYYFYSLKTKLFYNEMKHIRLIFSDTLIARRSMRIRTNTTRLIGYRPCTMAYRYVATRSSMHVHEYTRIRFTPTNFYHKIRS